MGYTPNELKGQLEAHKERRNELDSALQEAEAKECLIVFIEELDEAKEKFQSGDVSAIQAKYIIERIKSNPL